LKSINRVEAHIYPEMDVTAPSKGQLALALAVVKQKPPDKDVKGMNL
jgi:hypothetical protein